MSTEWTPQILLAAGHRVSVANVRVGIDALKFLAAAIVGAAHVARAAAALLRTAARARRRAGRAAGVRRHDVMRSAPQMRGRFAPQVFGIGMMFVYYGYLVPAEPAHRPRLLCRRHLVGNRLRAVLEDRRGGVARRRGGCPRHRVAAAEPGSPAGRAGRALRRRPPPASGENRRPRYTVVAHRAGAGGARRDGRRLAWRRSVGRR